MPTQPVREASCTSHVNPCHQSMLDCAIRSIVPGTAPHSAVTLPVPSMGIDKTCDWLWSRFFQTWFESWPDRRYQTKPPYDRSTNTSMNGGRWIALLRVGGCTEPFPGSGRFSVKSRLQLVCSFGLIPSLCRPLWKSWSSTNMIDR